MFDGFVLRLAFLLEFFSLIFVLFLNCGQRRNRLDDGG